jgi:hypothetical protein
MIDTIGQYFRQLSARFGAAWNTFWFTPRDARMVGVLRALTGIMALYFVLSHSADLVRWWGPDGMLNVATTQRLTGADQLPYTFRWSYFYVAQTPASLWLLHAAGVAVVLAYTLGIWSRLTSIGALFVVLSYVHRAPMITGQLEPVLTMLLAYLCLAPTGRHLAVDALLARRRRQRVSHAASDQGESRSLAANISTRLIQLHLAGLSIMIGLNMLAADVWWAGEGMWWLIARSESRLVDLTGLGHAMLLVNIWTHAVVAYLLLFGVLVWNRLARPLLLALGVPLWLSLALATGLMAWCLTMLVASLSFLESREPALPDGD